MTTLTHPRGGSPSAARGIPAEAGVSLETHRAVEQFLFRQAEILDNREWESWLNLFTKDGIYWMPASLEQTAGEGVPNIFYEDHYLMRTRAKRIEHPRAWSQHLTNRTSHVVSNAIVEREDPHTGDRGPCLPCSGQRRRRRQPRYPQYGSRQSWCA